MRCTTPSRVVLCLVAAFAASPAGAQGNANATVCAATDDSAFSPEQRIAACDALMNAVRNAPKEVADALVNRGQAAWYADKMKQAFADLDRAIARNAQAIADESEAIKLEPSEPAYFDNRGLSYAEEGDYDRAVIDYNEAIRISPQASFLINRGNAYQAKGDLSRAIADYDRAIQLNPASADAYNNRGAAFRGKGDLDRAIADYQAALRTNPRFETAAENLAAVQALRKRAMR